MSAIVTIEAFGTEYVLENDVWMFRPVTEGNSEDWEELDFDIYSDEEMDILRANGINRI
jgi:hypothetical protein